MDLKKQKAPQALQMLAIVALVIVIFIDSAENGNINFPNLVYGGLIGIAIGIDPDHLMDRFFKK